MPETLRVHDEFTGTSGTLLQNHVPTVLGTGWTLEFEEATSPAHLAITAGGTLFPTATRNSQRVIYSAQPNPIYSDQMVQARFVDRGPVDEPWILFCRADSGNWTNGYAVACYAGSTRLYKVVAGVVTQLASGAAIATGSLVSLRVFGTALSVIDDGATVLTANDGQIAQIGRWGIAAGDLFVATDDIDGQSFDSFKAWDSEAILALSPGAGALSLAGSAPQVNQDQTIVAGLAALSITGQLVGSAAIETPSWRIIQV